MNFMSSPLPSRSANYLADILRARVGAVDAPRVALGVDALDTRLGGGIARAALHDLYADEGGDASATAAFALMLALLIGNGPVAWVRDDRALRRCGALHADGLAELGADPAMLLLVMPDDDTQVLRAADDIVRGGNAAAVVIELHGRAKVYDLTASRRLALAARANGVLALMLRIGGEPAPSAAETRWRIASAPSLALAADAPGYPAFDITLLRHRGGIAGFDARLEWNRDTRSFASLPGRLPAAAVGGTQPRQRAA